MPKFMVEGADEKTGTDLKLLMDGPDRATVERTARAKGVLINRIVPREAPPARKPVEIDYAPDPEKFPDPLPPPNLPRIESGLAPEYRALKAMAFIFECFAALLYIGFVLSILAGAVMASNAAQKLSADTAAVSNPVVVDPSATDSSVAAIDARESARERMDVDPTPAAAFFIVAGPGLGSLIAGILFQGCGAFLLAFRDLVRNSFK